MTLAVIVNPSAGAGRAGRELPGVQAALRALGLDHRVERSESLDHARRLARDAAASGDPVVAFGGDGMVSSVADALRGSRAVLGVLPGGRGNDFARTLGIPLEPRVACEILKAGVVRTLDVGEVAPDGPAAADTFIGIASCGFDSYANRIANEARVVRGHLAYAYGALRALVRWRPVTFSLELDGCERRVVTGYTVAAANGRFYGGGMWLAPNAALDDGLLDIVIVEHIPRRTFLRLLPTVFKGEHLRLPTVEVLRAREVAISADRPLMMYADGEQIRALPLTVRAVPQALKVLVPQ